MSSQLRQERSLQEDSLLQEKEKLKLHIEEMQDKISEHQRSMCSVQAEYEKIKEESIYLHQQVGTLSCQLSEKDREINTLKELGVHQESLGGNGRTVEEVGGENKSSLYMIRSTEEERESRIQTLQQENTKYAKQLANLKDHLIEVCTYFTSDGWHG